MNREEGSYTLSHTYDRFLATCRVRRVTETVQTSKLLLAKIRGQKGIPALVYSHWIGLVSRPNSSLVQTVGRDESGDDGEKTCKWAAACSCAARTARYSRLCNSFHVSVPSVFHRNMVTFIQQKKKKKERQQTFRFYYLCFKAHSGEFTNYQRGRNQGFGGRKSPSGSPQWSVEGRSTGGLGASPQNLTTYFENSYRKHCLTRPLH